MMYSMLDNAKDANIKVVCDGKTWLTHSHILCQSKVLYAKLEWSKTPSNIMGTINLEGFHSYECLWILHYLYQGCRK